ncbi:MAG TPA: hypothetical protein VLA19_12535 [Herpetosiphonaceae bacterium]|nr:hypothetical protein [Herpetosiphonaceae bacterium]
MEMRRFLADYARQVFWHWDAKLGYVVTMGTVGALSASTVARSRLDDLASSGVTVAALGLTFSLTSMSLISAIVDKRMVEVLDGLERKHGSRAFGLHGLLTAFRSVAVIGGTAVALWLVVRAVAVDDLRGNAWDASQVVLGGLATGATVWLLGGLVGLVHTVSVLIGGKAELIRQNEGLAASPPRAAPDKTA